MKFTIAALALVGALTNSAEATTLNSIHQARLYNLIQMDECPEPLEISEEELQHQLGLFSRHLDLQYWDNAMKI